MPNLRSKTWTTTTPAYVEDAQFWEDHLISDADASKISSSVQSVNNITPDAQGNVDVVALPSGGTAGQVLTKQSSATGDADWEDPASSGHTIEDEDGNTMPYQSTLQFLNAEVTNDSADSKTVVDCKGAKGDAATVTAGTTTTLPAGSSATVTNVGTTSAAVFNFGIPQGADGADGTDGVSVTGVALISTSGKVKTYRMSFSDGSYFDFNVTDGNDGTGAGDMLQNDYDPNQTVYDAGGIVAYVQGQAYTLPTAASNVLGGVKVGTNLSIDANGVLSATDTNTDTLHDLTDVAISLPSDGQVLTYNNETGKWINQSIPTPTVDAEDVSYDNTSSGLVANDVQAAIDETVEDVANKHKITQKAVDITSGWTQDSTSQSGSTFYKKQITLNHIYVDSPTVEIGAYNAVLPTTAQQTTYDYLRYVTVDDTVPCIYLYADENMMSDSDRTSFYIDIEGVD